MVRTPAKCFANCHMTPEQFGFWEVCRSLSYKFKGKLVFDGRTIAEYFDNTGKDAVYRLAKRLCALGWFVCTKKSKRGKDGLWDSTEYRVLSHIEWVAKHGVQHCKTPVSESRLEQAEASFIQSGNPERSSLEIQNSPVWKSRHSTEETSLLRKKPSEELRPATQEPLKKRILIEAENEHGNAENARPVSESRLVYPNLFWDSKYDVRERWCHRLGSSKASPEELVELKRRNALRLTPTDFRPKEATA